MTKPLLMGDVYKDLLVEILNEIKHKRSEYSWHDTLIVLSDKCEHVLDLDETFYCKWCEKFTDHKTQHCPDMIKSIDESLDD